MPTKQTNMVMQHTRAQIAKNSFNKESRSFDVVFATETPVQSYNYEIGPYMECLSCDPNSVRMLRANNGLPVFDKHYPTNAMMQLGRASNVKFLNGQGTATITLGARADDALISDIENGIVDGISVGYNVYALALVSKEEGKLPVYRATDWEPGEISFAPIQADPNSRIRSEKNDGHAVTISNNLITNKVKKTIAEIRANASSEQLARLDAIILATRSAQLGDEKVVELFESEKAIEAIRSEYPEKVIPNIDLTKFRSEATKEVKERIDAILISTRAAKLEDSFAIELIQSDKNIEACRQAVIEKFAASDPKTTNTNTMKIGLEQSEKVRSAMEGALGHRVGAVKELTADAKEFRGMSLLRMAEESLIQSGMKTAGLSRREIAEYALGIKQTRELSRTDFPLILGSNVNRVLLASYELQQRTFMPFCSKGNAADFREMSRLKLSGLMDSFEEVKEGGEYKASSMTEAQEKYRVAKYGRKIAITWETLINDDLGAFTRMPAAIAAKAAQKQSDIVWAIMTGNPNMADGYALFEAAHHGNLAGSAAAITIASLAAARAAMRKQKGLEGDYINVVPEFLIVGPDKELEANQFTSANYVAVTNATINPDFNRALTVIVEPRLTGNQWYLAAKPGAIDTIEYAFLDGEGELFTEQRVGFDVDGLEIKARMVFGAKAIDHRGLYKNAGA